MFWTVWLGSALSLVVILTVPPLADLFRVALPPPVQIASAAFLGIVAVGWRLIPGGTGHETV